MEIKTNRKSKLKMDLRSKKYFYEVAKLVKYGESLLGKSAQSTKLTAENKEVRWMLPPQKINDYIVEEKIERPCLFFILGETVVPNETIWNIK